MGIGPPFANQTQATLTFIPILELRPNFLHYFLDFT